MFEKLQPKPADAILGLIAEHRDDPRPEKIDLGVGVYRTAAGETPILDVVKKAEHRLVGTQQTKAYLGTLGSPDFNSAMQALTFSDPTWNNHVPLLGGAGMKLEPYPYYDEATRSLRLDAMLETLHKAPKGDLVLLHACCHNPSGVDPTEDDWRAIADVIADRELVPFVDMAYPRWLCLLPAPRASACTAIASAGCRSWSIRRRPVQRC